MPASKCAFPLISSTPNDAGEEPIVSTVNDKGLVVIKTGQEEVKEEDITTSAAYCATSIRKRLKCKEHSPLQSVYPETAKRYFSRNCSPGLVT
jgi:hypothetical protein